MTPELERALRELEVGWPETPDIAGAVLTRLQQEAAPARRRPRFALPRPVLAYGAALLLVACAVGLAASPSARSAILEFLGLGSARIERREPTATPAPRAAVGAGLGLGRRVGAARAAELAGFAAAPPEGLGEPDAIYFIGAPPAGGRVSYVYAPRPGLPESGETGAGLLVTELRAVVEPVIEKAAGPDTRVERFRIDGDDAYFLSGAPHGIAFAATGSGEVVFEEQRLAGNTLLVERDGLLLRIEGRISRARAVRIARSIPATSGARGG